MNDSIEDDEDSADLFSCAVGAEGGRLDKVLASLCADLSRTRLKALILEGQGTIDGHPCKYPSAEVVPGQELTVAVPAPVAHYPEAEAIPLDIVYEDDD